MKTKLILLPFAAAAALAGVVAFHPGVALAAPRMASGPKTPLAADAVYTMDPMHAGIGFEITHMGLSRVTGRFGRFSGTVREDEGDLTKSSVAFTAQVDSIDTAVPPRDAYLKKAEYFDAATYPEMSFKSTKVEKTGEGYTMTGDLTMKGKTQSVTIPFRHYGPVKGMGGGPDRIGVIAEPITIRRSAFGIGATEAMPDGTMPLSDAVTVRISFEAVREKS